MNVGTHSSSIRLTIRTHGFQRALRRTRMVLGRFSLDEAEMRRSFEVYLATLDAFHCRATMPITACVLARHGQLLSWLAGRGIELAVHGLVHNDYRQMGVEEQRWSIARALEIFAGSGICAVGFRAPYLRANDETDVALRELGIGYHSSSTVAFPVVDGHGNSGQRAAYRRAMNLYQPDDAGLVAVRPRNQDGMVDLPVALPDDEILVDRFGLDEQQQAKCWTAILDRTHDRGELFTLQMHPEWIRACAQALGAILESARRLEPAVWIARLDEIAEWWMRRTACALSVETMLSAGEYRVRLEGDPRAVLLVRGARVPGSEPWFQADRIVRVRDFVVHAWHRPVIGISPRTPYSAHVFLREEGFVVEASSRRADFGTYIDAAAPTEAELLHAVDDSPGPLVRIWRWPDAARSALAITGDIDSITLHDFFWRVLETWR